MTDIEAAIAAIETGSIIGLPTDTVYGIAVDPFNQDAVDALFDLKQRAKDKPLPVLGASADELAAIGEVSSVDTEPHWPGGVSFVVARLVKTADGVGTPGSIALRVPAHSRALELLRRSGPLAVTSANLSGHPPALDDGEARSALGDAVAAYVAGSSFGGEPSTVVDLTGAAPVVLRHGPVAWDGDE